MIPRDETVFMAASVAFVVAMLLFFAVHQRMRGVEAEVASLKAVASHVETLEDRALHVDYAATRLASLPRTTRAMAAETQVGAMASAAADLRTRLGDTYRDRLEAVRQILDDIRQEMHSAP